MVNRPGEVACPVCGKVLDIPVGRGMAMVETHFLRHKEACGLPREDEYVCVASRVAARGRDVCPVPHRPHLVSLTTKPFTQILSYTAPLKSLFDG